MLSTRVIDYDVSLRDRAIVHGGIGLIHTLAQKVGLPQAIDERLHLLKVHLPYHESDHVLNIAYNTLCHGTCLQDIELRRNDDAFLDALGTQRIPDPTTAGDFCRRFTAADLDTLQDALDVARQVGADVLIKGLRVASDFEHELQQAQMNHEISGIDTLFIPCASSHSFIASNLVRQIARYGGADRISGMVPEPVAKRLQEKFA